MPESECDARRNGVTLLRDWLSLAATLDTWSEHQYHMDGMDMPMMTPGHGRSEVRGSLNRLKASSRGMPQVEFGTVTDGMALA